jgi:hypothetical protein
MRRQLVFLYAVSLTGCKTENNNKCQKVDFIAGKQYKIGLKR